MSDEKTFISNLQDLIEKKHKEVELELESELQSWLDQTIGEIKNTALSHAVKGVSNFQFELPEFTRYSIPRSMATMKLIDKLKEIGFIVDLLQYHKPKCMERGPCDCPFAGLDISIPKRS